MAPNVDAATQARLDRGYRMTELLKQGLYNPMPVIDQVLSIYAGTHGHLDKVPLKEVHDWESRFLQFVRDQKSLLYRSWTTARSWTMPRWPRLTQRLRSFRRSLRWQSDRIL